MCELCEAGIPHECRETGAFETGGQKYWYGARVPKDPVPPYLNPNFQTQPANADGPRRTEDMHRKDYSHHDPVLFIEQEVRENFQILELRDATDGICAI